MKNSKNPWLNLYLGSAHAAFGAMRGQAHTIARRQMTDAIRLGSRIFAKAWRDTWLPSRSAQSHKGQRR